MLPLSLFLFCPPARAILTGQLAACVVCVVMSTTVLCMFSKHSYAVAGVLYALACVLDVGQFVRW